ncbi:PE-PGRS family protein, partial [Mycobacterium tuberculosis C]
MLARRCSGRHGLAILTFWRCRMSFLIASPEALAATATYVDRYRFGNAARRTRSRPPRQQRSWRRGPTRCPPPSQRCSALMPRH